MTEQQPNPLVSVLLPTYNRASFLPAAFDAISRQSWTNCEVVVVDDGSTDGTIEIVQGAARQMIQRVVVVRQPNAGAYGARNTALEHSTGEFVAFYDSDDAWLPHHVENCVRAMIDNPDVDWVYGACRSLEYSTGRIIAPDTFRIDSSPRPFMQLQASIRGPLHVLPIDGLVECAVLHGLYCGLQNSVIRCCVFADNRFHASLRNEAEDQLFVIRAIKRGHRLGYLDDVHVEYRVHECNSSGSAIGPMTLERRVKLLEPVARGFEELRQEFTFTPGEHVALRRRLHREYFWHLGYSTFKASGVYNNALLWFRRGLREWPWSPRAWKTYAATRVQALLQ